MPSLPNFAYKMPLANGSSFLRAGLPSAFRILPFLRSKTGLPRNYIQITILVTMRSTLPIIVAFLVAAVTSTIAAPMRSDSQHPTSVRLCCSSFYNPSFSPAQHQGQSNLQPDSDDSGTRPGGVPVHPHHSDVGRERGGHGGHEGHEGHEGHKGHGAPEGREHGPGRGPGGSTGRRVRNHISTLHA